MRGCVYIQWHDLVRLIFCICYILSPAVLLSNTYISTPHFIVRILGRDMMTSSGLLPKGSICALHFLLLFRNPWCSRYGIYFMTIQYVHYPTYIVVVVVEAMQYSKANKAKEDAPQMIMKLWQGECSRKARLPSTLVTTPLFGPLLTRQLRATLITILYLCTFPILGHPGHLLPPEYKHTPSRSPCVQAHYPTVVKHGTCHRVPSTHPS